MTGRPISLVEKLEHVTNMARSNHVNKAEIRWRLQYIVDELRDPVDGAFIDALCKLETNHYHRSND